MKKIKFLSLFLAALTVVSVFAACGGNVDTTASEEITDVPETEAPATEAPETEAPVSETPETEAPETEAPETEAPETEAPESEIPPIEAGMVVENGAFKSIWLDFESELGLKDYIDSVGGFSVNEKLNGGDIVDGKWTYSDKAFAFKDDCGIYDLDSFSIRFDICFNSFANKDGTSVFSFISDDDGVLGGTSVIYALKLDMNGKLYHFNQKDNAKQLKTGVPYTIRYDIDRVAKKATIYFNGEQWVSANFPLANNVYNCFRFIDSGRGADLWIDNLIVSTEPLTFATQKTGAQGSDDSSSDAPQGEASTFEKVVLDFESTLGVEGYISSVGSFSVNEKLNGGEIVGGKWVYSGAPLAIADECGIFDAKSYSLEFDVCFNSYVNKDGTSVFTFITDNDGKLDGSSSFYALKMDTDGKLYHFSLKGNAIQVELGKTYNIRYEINRETKVAVIYVDDAVWVTSTGYGQENQAYNCYRFMDVNRGADVWFDNFSVTNTGIEIINYVDVVAIDAAYVCGGKNADIPQKLASGKYIDIKYVDTTTHHMYREGLIKFDISSLDVNEVGHSKFLGEFVNMTADRTFDIYWIEDDWDGQTVTYNNLPQSYLIAEDIAIGGAGAPLELAPYIIEALRGGDKTFSIRIVPKSQNGDGQTRILFDGTSKPTVRVFFEKTDKSYFEKLTADEKTNKEIWDYAQQMYDEWYARYQAIVLNDKAEMLDPDETQYIRSSYASEQSSNFAKSKQLYKSRPLEGITDLNEYVSTEFKNAKLDKYGGIMVESLKQKATGYFYTTKIDGRWFVIDPLGYPYIIIGLSLIDYSLNGSKLQAQNALDKYGSYEKWAAEVTKEVRDDFGFNSTFTPTSEIEKVNGGLPYVKSAASPMANYALVKGGTSKAIENNVMPVFDPDFVGYADSKIKAAVAGYEKDPNVIGFTADNELPMDFTMLDNALKITHSNPVNYYTYACTWTWFVNMTGKESPTYDDITDELRDLYRGFVYDRYFYVVSNSFEKSAPNHMYMGCKFLPYVKDSKWVFAFAAQYVDIVTINWYFCWEPETDVIYNIEKYGDVPFMVSEFYTKAGDATVSGKAGSEKLANTSGAGWYVETQKDRADYYDTYIIKLLESNNGVGWQWFHYMDNDPNSGTADKTSINSNKGICRSDLTYYTELTDRMSALNKNVYNLINYFANKNAK